MMNYVRLDIAALMAVAPWACICVWWGCPMMRQAWREADVPECPFYLSVLSKRGIAGHGWTARDVGGRRCNHHRGRIQPPDVAQTGVVGFFVPRPRHIRPSDLRRLSHDAPRRPIQASPSGENARRPSLGSLRESVALSGVALGARAAGRTFCGHVRTPRRSIRPCL